MSKQIPGWQQTVLADEVVILKPLAPGDFDVLFQLASDPLIWEQHPARDRYKIEVFTRFFEDGLAGGSAYLIVDKLTGMPIGCTRYYEYQPQLSGIAIGYTFLARTYWGGAFNRSAKTLLLDNAFDHVDRVYFHIGPDNIRSQTAIARLGAVKIGERQLEGESMHYEYLIEKSSWTKAS